MFCPSFFCLLSLVFTPFLPLTAASQNWYIPLSFQLSITIFYNYVPFVTYFQYSETLSMVPILLLLNSYFNAFSTFLTNFLFLQNYHSNSSFKSPSSLAFSLIFLVVFKLYSPTPSAISQTIFQNLFHPFSILSSFSFFSYIK